MQLRNLVGWSWIACWSAIVGGIGCAASETAAPAGAGGTTDDGGPADGSTGGTGGNFEASVYETGQGDADPDAACEYIVEQGNHTPLSLYIMYDKSSSMVGTKWDSAKLGMQAFLEDPKSAGIKVAFNLFPRDPDGTPECDHFAYKTPKVVYGDLPQNAVPILTLLNGEAPDGTGTPIYPALGGAILAARDVAVPGESSAVLLVTDGEPQGPATLCSGVDPEDPQVIAELASTAADWSPPVYTYVIGLPGANQAFATQVAAAGKGEAILIGSGNVQTEFQKALATVLGKALPCEFVIPSKVENGDINADNVNVVYTPGGGTDFETIPQTGEADCGEGGWFYDDPASPTLIVLCPSTCEALKEDLEGKIEIMLGCKTVVK